jgi:hypothetical protein
MTMTASRHRLPWSMSETNRLYSEYEMKQLPISSIAQLHSRTEYAILHKLAQECMINASWNDVKGWKNAPKELKKPTTSCVYDYDEDDESEYEEDDHDSDSDYEEFPADKEGSVISEESLEDCDDPNDSDYVDEEEDEDDSSDYEDEDEDEEFDAYSIPQKVSSFKKIVDAAKFFIYAA